MSAETLIQQAAADGVTLVLDPVGKVKARGNPEVLNRWAPILRKHKPEIVAALADAANDPNASRWRLTFADRDPLEVVTAPPMSRDEVTALYGAIDARPLPEPAAANVPTFEEWTAAAHALCNARADGDDEHRQALLDDYATTTPAYLRGILTWMQAETIIEQARRKEH